MDKDREIILSVVLDRKTLDTLNFELIDPSDALGNFNYNMKYHKTAGLRGLEKITIYYILINIG